jgi:hypothetical protein
MTVHRVVSRQRSGELEVAARKFKNFKVCRFLGIEHTVYKTWVFGDIFVVFLNPNIILVAQPQALISLVSISVW